MRISDWSSDVCSSDLATPSRYCSSISKAWQGRRSERSPASPPISSQRKFTVSRRNWRAASRRKDPQHDRRQRPASPVAERRRGARPRSEEHTSELQSLMRISYAVFCLKKKKHKTFNKKKT